MAFFIASLLSWWHEHTRYLTPWFPKQFAYNTFPIKVGLVEVSVLLGKLAFTKGLVSGAVPADFFVAAAVGVCKPESLA